MTHQDPSSAAEGAPDAVEPTASDSASAAEVSSPELANPESSEAASSSAETAVPDQGGVTQSGPVSPFAPSVYSGISDSYSRAQYRAQEADKKRARTLGVFVTAALLVGGLLGGTAGGAFAIWNLSSRGLVSPGVQSPQTITVNAPAEASEITAVAAQVMPSVVTIEVAGVGGAGSGSGVIISEDGHVMTNAHVVSVGSEEPSLRVTTSDGRLLGAEVIGRDILSDIAVIKIDSEGPFPVMAMGDSDALNVGDETIAIGAPLGLPGTVTSGIVSAINRSITVGASSAPGEEDGQFDFDLPGGVSIGQTISLPVIQTDASINPGNSGGALLNTSGELIGVNVAIASTGGQGSGSIGLGFAIPSNFALRVATELIESGSASHGLLGALVTDASSVASATVTGAYIDSVTPGGAADRAGIRAGDVVTRFNGLPVTNRIDLTAQVRVLPGGTTATVTYVRSGNTYTVEVALGDL
ncbi:MAG: trypsin-like peptidase domain-containing protein [Actinomycetota bacterium]|nr:trypsin-like peptidase domain-containing protein [Actinomycetota bacterium]